MAESFVDNKEGTTARVSCQCENNKSLNYYLGSDYGSLIEQGYQRESILESDGHFYMKAKFAYWDESAGSWVEPTKICQIPMETEMKDKIYQDNGAKRYYYYYDKDQYYWGEDLQEEHMYAACDEQDE